jgi:Holliday junction resolvase RusA-like endonuclease
VSFYYWVTGINPEPWAIGSPFRRGNKGLGISPNTKLKAYQDAIREEFPLQNAHARLHEGDLSVKFYFWRSSAYGNLADATNLQKATEDALQKILYHNDRSNHHVQSDVMEQTPETNPHILIIVEPWEKPEILIPISAKAPKWAGTDWVPPSEELF